MTYNHGPGLSIHQKNDDKTETNRIIQTKNKKSLVIFNKSKNISSSNRKRIIPEIVSPKCSSQSVNKMVQSKSFQSHKFHHKLSSPDPNAISSNSLSPKKKQQHKKISNSSSFDISWFPKLFNIENKDEIRHKKIDINSDDSINICIQNVKEQINETVLEDQASPLCETDIE